MSISKDLESLGMHDHFEILEKWKVRIILIEFIMPSWLTQKYEISRKIWSRRNVNKENIQMKYQDAGVTFKST